jgi:CheY-like chemotaxis protein
LGVYLKRKALEYELTPALEGSWPKLGYLTIACLVTDYHMPGMDGLELVDELRRRGSSIPAILLTGDPNQHVRARAAAAHVPVIEKLGSGERVVECIQKVVKSWVN